MSCGPFEQVQDSPRSEIARPVGETTTDGQKQNWQVAFPSKSIDFTFLFTLLFFVFIQTILILNVSEWLFHLSFVLVKNRVTYRLAF